MGKAIMYERIYADLLAKIQNGDYQPGDRLPSEKESAELYGVSRITAKKAMDMLAKEKKISREPGRGSFVCSPAAAVEMKKESRGTANQRIGVISMGLEAILAHGFCRGLRANVTGDSQIFCLSVLMEVSKRKNRRSTQQSVRE